MGRVCAWGIDRRSVFLRQIWHSVAGMIIMIISRGRAFIFVHIPKTGGMSLALALETRAMKADILIWDTPKAIRRPRRLKEAKAADRFWKPSTLADMDGLVLPEQPAQAFTATLVRNPWDSGTGSGATIIGSERRVTTTVLCRRQRRRISQGSCAAATCQRRCPRAPTATT